MFRKKSKKKILNLPKGPALNIGSPKGFKHKGHMSPNKRATWGIDGMPKQWKKELAKTEISKHKIFNQSEKLIKAMKAMEKQKLKKRTVLPEDDQELEARFEEHEKINYKSPWGVYHRGKVVGKGAGGTVYKGRWKQGTQDRVALKVCPAKDLKYIKSEIAIQGLLNHKNIVKIRDTWKYKNELIIAMEFCQATLTNILGTEEFDIFPEPHIAYVAHECLNAVAYMHSQFVIHRDIKSDNVLITSRGEVKLADFGFSVGLSKATRRRRSIVGTTFWMAPEVIEGQEYDELCDIWSLGITVLEMSDQEPPHMQKEHVEALLDILVKVPPKPNDTEMWSYEFVELVERMLTRSPLKRDSASQLLESSKFLEKRATQEEFSEFVQFMLNLRRKRRFINQPQEK